MDFCNKIIEKGRFWVTKDSDGLYIWNEIPMKNSDGDFYLDNGECYWIGDMDDNPLYELLVKIEPNIKRGEMKEVEIMLKY